MEHYRVNEQTLCVLHTPWGGGHLRIMRCAVPCQLHHLLQVYCRLLGSSDSPSDQRGILKTL